MKFILIADDDAEEKNFFPIWEIVIFVLVSSMILILFFPQNLVEKTLATHDTSPVVLNYLQGFSALDPNNQELTIGVLEQEVNLGLLKKAQLQLANLKSQPMNEDTKTQVQWIDYLMLRHKAFKAKLNTQKRIDLLKQVRTQTQAISNLPLKGYQLESVAMDSLSVAQAPTALKIFNRLYANNELKTAEDFAKAGDVAMQNNAHSDAAKFYKLAFAHASTLGEKRKYAMDIMNVLWAGNQLKAALEFGQKLPEEVVNERDMLLYLARLAIANNQPEAAQSYALKALMIDTKYEY